MMGMVINGVFGVQAFYQFAPILIIGLIFGIINIIQKESLVKRKDEYILCAANHYDDGKKHVHQPKNIKTGFVVCGQRHSNCIHTFALMAGFPYDENGLKLKQTEEQGFITNTNMFVDREQAAEIALNAGQIKKPIRLLHSEDLY